MTPVPRHFLRDDDLSPAEQAEVLDLADRMKADRFAHAAAGGPAGGRGAVRQASTRTRVSFAVGIAELGGHPLIIDAQPASSAGARPIEDTARVLDRQSRRSCGGPFGAGADRGDGRGQRRAGGQRAHRRVPPLPVLADLQTIREHKGGWPA